MNYIFGTRMYDGKETEFVKIVDDHFVEMDEGKFVTYTFDNGAINITHHFRILWKYKQDIDLQNNYQTWYYIDNHTKEVDNTSTIFNRLDNQSATIQEQSNAIDEIIMDLLNS